jgi:hypothetical protein
VKPLWSLPILLAAAGAALGRPSLLGRDPPPVAGTADRPHPAVVRVIVPDGTGMSLGSGALVAVTDKLGLVVTNWHVVRDAQGQIVVAFPDGFRSGATVLGTDRDWDLAALAIWRPNVDPIPLATRPPQPGEPLTIAGYGSGRYRAVTGRCTQYVAPGRKHPFEMVELSAGARQGDSGGPIFNGRGELAGVLFGAAWGRTTGSYCGRVGQFLTSVADPFQRLDAGSTMIAGPTQPQRTPIARPTPSSASAIAQRAESGRHTPPQPSEPERTRQESSPRRTLPVVSIPGRPSVPAEPGGSQPLPLSPDAGWTGSPPYPDVQDPPAASQANEPLRWQDIAGTTRTDQLKTILAAIGLLAIFVQGVKLLSRSEDA